VANISDDKYIFFILIFYIFVKYILVFQNIFNYQNTEMDSIIDLICELKKKCIESDSQFISSMNISDAEYNLIKALINCTKFDSKSISKKMCISPSRVSRIIDKAVKNGYLERTQDTIDRRLVNIKLTVAGKELRETISKFRKKCDDAIIKSLPEFEIESLKKNLETIIEIL